MGWKTQACMVWLLIGSVAAAITTMGFVPQIVKMWRTRSVQDLSPITFLQFLVGISLWTAYAVHLGDPLLIVTNIVALSIMLVATVLYFHLSRRRGR